MTKFNQRNENMSMNGEIKYDGSDNVKLNEEVNVEVEESSQQSTNIDATGGLCGSSSLKENAGKGANKELIQNMR